MAASTTDRWVYLTVLARSLATAAAAMLLFCDRTRRQICRRCIPFPHSKGGCYVYMNSASLRVCRRTAVDDDGRPGANRLLRRWELRR